MAKKVTVKIEGKETVSKASKTAKAGLKGLDQTVKNSTLSMLKSSVAIGAVVMALRKINQVMNDLQEAYFEQEKAESMFRAALKATGTETEVSAKSIFKFASELQRMTIYGDEAILSATSLLQSLAKLNDDGLKQIMPLMLDFATGMKVDLNTAMSLVGKTLGSTTNALARYGIVIDMTLSKEEKLAELTKQLESSFGGMAAAIGDTAYGATIKLDNAIGDFKEQLGRTISYRMKPFREELVKIVTEMTNLKRAINDAAEYINKLGEQQVTAAESLEYWNTQLAQSESNLSKLWSRMWRGKKIQSEEYIKAKIAEYEIQVKIEEAAKRYDDKIAARLAKELATAQEKATALQLLFDIETEALERLTELTLEALSPLERKLKLVQDELNLYSDLKKEFEKYSQGWIAVEEVILALLGKEKKVRAEIAGLAETDIVEKVKGLEAAYARTEQGMREALEIEKAMWMEQIKRLDLTGTEILQIIAVMSELDKRLEVEKKITDEIKKRPSLLPQAGTPPIAGATGGGAGSILGPFPMPMREVTAELQREIELVTALESGVKGVAEAFGAVIIGAENAGEIMKRAFTGAIATAIRALAEMAFVEAGIAFGAQQYLKSFALAAAGAAALVSAGAVQAMASGGIINEPVLGVGASGQRYLFGESGPERVSPVGKGGGGNIYITVEGSILAERELEGIVLRVEKRLERGY